VIQEYNARCQEINKLEKKLQIETEQLGEQLKEIEALKVNFHALLAADT